ncbi:MAG: hypothetical protein ABH811_01205 [archaeon]
MKKHTKIIWAIAIMLILILTFAKRPEPWFFYSNLLAEPNTTNEKSIQDNPKEIIEKKYQSPKEDFSKEEILKEDLQKTIKKQKELLKTYNEIEETIKENIEELEEVSKQIDNQDQESKQMEDEISQLKEKLEEGSKNIQDIPKSTENLRVLLFVNFALFLAFFVYKIGYNMKGGKSYYLDLTK